MWLLNTHSSARQHSVINYTYCYHWRVVLFWFFFAWINQNIFFASLPDYYHPWCEEHLCMWSRETQSCSMWVSSGPETQTLQSTWIYWFTLVLNQRIPCITRHPTDTGLECKEGKFWGKPVNFRLYLGVLRCSTGQAAKTAEGVKLLSN